MMIFTDVQLVYLRARARGLLADLTISQGLQQSGEYLRQMIEDELKEAYSMGRSIALDEVCATPWEYEVVYASSHTVEKLNELSAAGWELLFPFDGSKLIWRRRKAVREIEKAERAPSERIRKMVEDLEAKHDK